MKLKAKANSIFKQLSEKYKTPYQVQRYIDSFAYNREKSGATLRPPLLTLKAKKAHCFEAALLAAAVLEHKGYPPLILSLESKDGLDHILYIFKENNKWGAVGKSREPSLQGRPAQYRSVRDLVWSYFDAYIDDTCLITAYETFHLDELCKELKFDWRVKKDFLWDLEDLLLRLPHKKLKSSKKRYLKFHLRYLNEGPLPPKDNWW